MPVIGSAYVAPFGTALMNSKGAYGFPNEKLSRPLISPDWNSCPAIVERENMSARSSRPGSPSARSTPTLLIFLTLSLTKLVVRCRGWLDSTGNRSPVGFGSPNSGISHSKSERKDVLYLSPRKFGGNEGSK